MIYEYLARISIVLSLTMVAVLTEAEGIRYLCLSIAAFVLLTIGCLVIIERDGKTEDAKQFRKMYLGDK